MRALLKLAPCMCGCVFVYVCSLQELRKPRQAKVYVMIQFNMKWALSHHCRKFLSENAATSLCFAYSDSPTEWCSLLPSFLLPSFVYKNFQIFIFNSPHFWVSDVTTHLLIENIPCKLLVLVTFKFGFLTSMSLQKMVHGIN